jgi:hypothetical protein
VFDAEHAREGLPRTCAIFLNEELISGIVGGDLGYLMAFQTFHCFAITANPGESMLALQTRALAPWAWSGAGAWAAATVAQEAFGSAGDLIGQAWTKYSTTPEVSLHQRTVDAIGFFAQVDHSAPPAWNIIDRTLGASGGDQAFAAATEGRQSFTDLWAAGYFRNASFGPDWDIAGPGITADAAEAASIEIANGESDTLAAAALAIAIADLSTSADVTTLAGEHLRLHDGVQDLTEIGSRTFCTRPGGSNACVCPKDTPGAKLPPLPSLNADVKLALTGMETGAAATVQGLSLEQYCGQPPTAQPASGVWSLVFWSPDMGDTAPPLLLAYTCEGLESTWKAIYLPSLAGLTRTFELPFGDGLGVHQDVHYDVPADQQSNEQELDYALDFTLDPSAEPPVITVSGTKTVTEGDQTRVFAPREFGSDAPLELKNVSLETQLEPYPDYQHAFRTQAREACGG